MSVLISVTKIIHFYNTLMNFITIAIFSLINILLITIIFRIPVATTHCWVLTSSRSLLQRSRFAAKGLSGPSDQILRHYCSHCQTMGSFDLPLFIVPSSRVVKTFLGTSSSVILIKCPAHLKIVNLIYFIMSTSLKSVYNSLVKNMVD